MRLISLTRSGFVCREIFPQLFGLRFMGPPESAILGTVCCISDLYFWFTLDLRRMRPVGQMQISGARNVCRTRPPSFFLAGT
jgi:hypothetical protein